MMKRLILGVMGLLLAVQARAASPGVYDNGGFFSQDAIAQANQTISDIKKSTGKDLMVETYSSIPADMKGNYDPANKNDFFEKWLVSRARVQQVNGVFVLICRDPSHLQVDVGKDTRNKAFTVANRDQLRNRLVDQFKGKNFDQGLIDGVKYVQSTMQANLGSSAAAQGGSSYPTAPTAGPTYSQPSGPTGPVATSSHHIGILPVIIVIGVIIFLARAFLRTRNNSYGSGYGQSYGGMNPPPIPPTNYGGYGNQYPPPASGGGFGRGLLGGLLGGALGGYMYDRTTHRNDQSGNSPSGGGGGFPENSGSSNSGGDFNSPTFDSGNQGAGGDFGGGGDSGGGGGGGGDSGGGGGSGGDF